MTRDAVARAVGRRTAGFVRALRESGLQTGVDQGETFARAVSLVDPTSRRELYLAARATLVVRQGDVPAFDAIFAAYWADGRAARARKVPWAPRHDRASQRTALVAYMAERARPEDPEVLVPEDARAASPLDLLQRKDFAELTAEERASIERALRELRLHPALRETRRQIASRRGDAVDPRRLLRSAARQGGAAFTLPRRRRKVKRRPLVILADISGSMEIYSRLLLQFFHGLTRHHRMTETFVFATRLTRITAQLQLRDVDQALDQAAFAIVDFAGGTRIGESLRAFNRGHARRVLRGGAVVLLVSDGWETGDVDPLRAEVKRLASGCHRLIWLNPLLGRATYRPFATGMAVALEHVDDFLPIHNLKSLLELSAHLARLPSRKAPRASRRRSDRGEGAEAN